MSLTTLAACQVFVESQPPHILASQLRKDQRICQTSSGFPTLLVYCLPPAASNASQQIAQALSTDDAETNTTGTHVPLVVSRMRLAGVVQCIKSYLANMKRQNTLMDDEGMSSQRGDGPIPSQLVPSNDEWNAALKVLRYLQLPPSTNLDDSTPLSDVVATIEAQMSLGADVRSAQLDASSSTSFQVRRSREERKRKKPTRSKKCYICLYVLTTAHPFYPSICVPCGNFNTASSALSLPPEFDMTSKTAVVTGARINLGYHTALRLLRSGCNVIVTTRYPRDAETRYLTEPDSATWSGRLRIVGADFRTARDVFALVGEVKKSLHAWQAKKLDLLINNAAQTLTDQVDVEIKNGEREQDLRSQGVGSLVTGGNYEPRLRGGMATIEYEVPGLTFDHKEAEASSVTHDPRQQDSAIVKPAEKSSWTQKLSEIPYEDVVSAHSINTFVPLILIRELLPIMSSPAHTLSPSATKKTSGYIVNVSSREGIPEAHPSHPSKAGHHVHTNMTKAALNMLTETEAAEAWKTVRVAINSVDPGYMSADPQYMEMVNMGEEDCPIGWEDGAARVLWPVAMGEKGSPVWGRFLKHFQSIEVRR